MKWYLLILLPFFYSCGPTLYLDYNPEVDFDQFKTYMIYPSLETGLSQLNEKRVLRFTDSILQAKGLEPSERPDLFINFYTNEILVTNNSTIGIGIGSGGRNGGVSVAGGIPLFGSRVQQEFTIDIIDVLGDHLIWQGTVQKNYPQQSFPEVMDEHYRKIVTRILSNFPPGSNK